jgi:dihydroorotase
MIDKLDSPVIDLHVHLRNDIPYHTRILKDGGIDVVLYMPNSVPPLDNVETIENSLRETRYCQAIPVSAITKNREGKELVDVEKIRKLVAGFSDDGNCLDDFGLVREMFEMGVLLLPHCCPSYAIAVEHPELQLRYLDSYLNTYARVGTGFLHIQHVSRKEEVELIRDAKKSGLPVTCETGPHYLTWPREELYKEVNPPLGRKEDVEAVREGSADGTIDVFASDYAPLPRITGIAAPDLYIAIYRGLVSKGILSEEQLKDKLYTNPKRIIESGGYRLNL